MPRDTELPGVVGAFGDGDADGGDVVVARAKRSAEGRERALGEPAQGQRLWLHVGCAQQTLRAGGTAALAVSHDGVAVGGCDMRVTLHDFRVCNWQDGNSQSHSLDTGSPVSQTCIGATRARKPSPTTQLNRGRRNKGDFEEKARNGALSHTASASKEEQTMQRKVQWHGSCLQHIRGTKGIPDSHTPSFCSTREDIVPDTMALPGSSLSTKMNNSKTTAQKVFDGEIRWDAD